MQEARSGSTSGSIMDRLMGIITFKAPVYREIAEDTTATGQAATIVIVVSLLTYLIQGVLTPSTGIVGAIAAAIAGAIGALIQWFIGAWLLAWVSTTFFNGRTNTGEMLRVVGYTSVFTILSLIPISGSLAILGGLLAFIGGILYLIGYIIGIREAAEISTAQAIGTAIIAVVIVVVVLGFLIALVVGAIATAVAIAMGISR
jgi:hypothetical protein